MGLKRLRKFVPPKRKPAGRPQDGEEEIQKHLVVYVEDNKDNWEVTQLALQRRFRLLWAQNSEEACQLFLAQHAQIFAILMDIELQGSALDGIQLTRLLRGTLPVEQIPPYAMTMPVIRTPILFVTAFTARYGEAELIAAGGNKLITKPVNFAELSLALGELDVKQTATSVVEIARLSGEPDISADRLAGEIVKDPELAQRFQTLLDNQITRTGRQRVAGKLHEVAEQLGVRLLRDMAICLAVVDLLPEGKVGRALLPACLRRAVAARMIAERIVGASADDAFAVGLLLESGLLARARHDPTGALDVAESPAKSRPVWERSAGEVEHPKRGAQLAREWNLGEEIIMAVHHHHDEKCPAQPLARIGWAAERLGSFFELGDVGANFAAAVIAGSEFGLNDQDVETLLRSLPREVVRIAASLEKPIGDQPDFDSLMRARNATLIGLNQSYEKLVQTLDALVVEKSALLQRLRAVNISITDAKEKDLALIAAVQNFFLPRKTFHRTGGVEVCGFYRAATQCGGDWWWYEAAEGSPVWVVIGDVTGHGPGAAMVTGAAASCFRMLRKLDPGAPMENVLARLHIELLDITQGEYCMTVSAVAIADDPPRLRWWNAGAPPLLVLRSQGSVDTIPLRGTPIGLDAGDFVLGHRELDLSLGERVLVFTDGLSELDLGGDRQLGIRRLAALFANTGHLDVEQATQSLAEQLDHLRQGVPQNDDMTFAIIGLQA